MIVSHLVAQNLVSGTIISEKLSLLRTQTHDVQDNLFVVIGIVMISAGRIGLESGLTLGPVLAGGHEYWVRRNRNTDLGLESIALREKVVAELLLKHSQFGTDFLETSLFSLTESHAIVYKAVIQLLGNDILLAVESFSIVQNRFHAGEEPRIHEDVVRCCGNKRSNLVHHLLHLRSRI